jgi:hypothetical protein
VITTLATIPKAPGLEQPVFWRNNMKRMHLTILFAGLLLLAGNANSGTLEVDIIWPNQNHVICTNLAGTGDQFSIEAELFAPVVLRLSTSSIFFWSFTQPISGDSIMTICPFPRPKSWMV